MTKEKRWWQSAHIFEFFKRRWKKSIDLDFGHKEEEEEDEEEGKGERTSSYTFATSSSPSISSSRFLPSSFRRLSCSNLCFAWSVFDAWRRDGRALMMFCARSYLLFLFDRQRRTHTHKKTNTTNTTNASPPTQQPRRRRTLFERRPFRDDHRSNAFCDSEPRRSRPNHHQRTRDDDGRKRF